MERVNIHIRTVVPNVCFECDKYATHRHHVVPVSQGGRRVVWLCEGCHEKTHGYQEGLYAMMRTVRATRQRQGHYTGGSRFGGRRYGSRLVKVDGKLTYQPVPEEQEVINRICEACPDGRGYSQMARTLNTEGVPTVTGAPWSMKVVRSIALRGIAGF